MVDFLIQATLSNFLVATLLALIAWAVQRRVQSASLVNLLWALVLIKMVTPPLFAIPVFEIPSIASIEARASRVSNELSPPIDPRAAALNGDSTKLRHGEVQTSEMKAQSTFASNRALAATFLFALWLCTMLFLVSVIGEKNWQAPAALRMAIVALAICVFPLGFVHAQDFDAVEHRLDGAVEAGELSLEQASMMMDALRRSSADDMDAKKRRYLEAAREIEAAVEAGKVSREDAETRLIEMRKAMFGEPAKTRNADLEAKKKRYMEAAREIEAAVEAGKVSKKDAEKRLIEMRKAMFDNHRE